MEKSRNQKGAVMQCCLMYTIVWGIITAILIIPMKLLGKTFISVGDGYNQFYPACVYIKEYLQRVINGIFSGNFIIQTYDLSIGYGEDIIAALNHYGFGDIFMLFTVFFPKESMIYCYEFLIFVKIYISGLVFLCCQLDYKKMKIYSLVIGSIAYAFSPFSLIYGTHFPSFLTVTITIPLIISGINELFRNNKICSYKLIGAIAIQALTGFYFLYMETLIIIIYCLYQYISNKQFLSKQFFRYFVVVGLNYSIGVFLASPILIPVIIGYFHSSRVSHSYINFRELLFDRDWKGIIVDSFIPTSNLKGLMLPVIVFPCIILHIFYEKMSKNKVLSIAIYSMIFVPAVGFIMNGFSYTTTRWYFIIYFVSSCMLVRILPKLVKFSSKKYIKTIGISYILMLVFWSVGRTNYKRTCIYFIIYLLLLSIILIAIYCKSYKGLYLSAILSIIVNIGLLFFKFGDIGAGMISEFVDKDQFENVLVQVEQLGKNWNKEIDNKGVRIAASDMTIPINSSLIERYYGDTSYYSMSNQSVSNFFIEYAIDPAVRTASFIVLGTDHRDAINNVLSVENSVLSMGFTYDSYITEKEFQMLNEMQRNELILKSAVVENEITTLDLKKDTPNFQSKVLDCNFSVENADWQGNKLKVESGSKIVVEVNNLEEGTIYLKLKGIQLNDGITYDILGETFNLQIGSTNNEYYRGNDDYFVNAGSYGVGKQKITIQFTKEAQFSLQDIEAWVYPDYVYKEDLNQLVQNDRCVNIEYGINKITGELYSNQKQLLYFSIPYNKGWTAWDNGTPCKLVKTNIGFMSIEIGEGYHTITLQYKTQGLYIGIICFIFGIVLFLGIFYLNKSKEKEYKL